MVFFFSPHSWNSISFLFISIALSLLITVSTVSQAASYGSVVQFRPSPWKYLMLHFTAMKLLVKQWVCGACGYGNLFDSGYGTNTAALSTTLFNKGIACGTCYQMKCVNSKWCYGGSPSITVTATNLCPPNWAQNTNNGGWCNPPRTHFDLAKPAFMKLAQWKAGIVPVTYRRVPCVKPGGLRFKFQGNGYWLLVYVMNVAGGGDISNMWVRGKTGQWISMSHNWGASYQAFAVLGGQALSFKVQSYSTREIITASYVTPSNWNTGMTYKSSVNFRK
ncbi:hypothetical protein MKX01_041409 [Papaver californicum]|nr:hypothetical protein MKX01_041409 [Papaver californicum]